MCQCGTDALAGGHCLREKVYCMGQNVRGQDVHTGGTIVQLKIVGAYKSADDKIS